MPTSSSTMTVLSVRESWPCSSRQIKLAKVRDPAIRASWARLLAAWPEVAVPKTSWPDLSNALRHGTEHGRLAGARHPYDDLGTTARRTDAGGRLPLLVRERRPELLLAGSKGFLQYFVGDSRAVAAGQLAAHRLCDGRFPGQHRGQRVGRFACAGDADEGHHFGVGQGPVDQSVEDLGGLAVKVRGHGHDHVSTRKRPCAGRGRRRPQAPLKEVPGRLIG